MGTQDTSKVSRRNFMKESAVLTAAAGLGTSAQAGSGVYKSILPQQVLGANERVHTGHIAVGNMGAANLRFALGTPGIKPVAICDLWPPYRERAKGIIQEAGHDAPAEYIYFEELLEHKDIDAVVVCTPDHWHAIPSIMACDAGKDVWCEKPVATTIREGRAMVEAARRNNTVFQAGTMQRSGEHFKEAVQMIQSGYIGQISKVHCWVNEENAVEGLGNPPDQDPPEGLDWDRYLGWTPKVPFNQNRFHYHFRWFKEYSSGNICDWGVHLIDIVMWAMGESNQPKKVSATGGKFVLTDNRNTPDQIQATWEFDDYTLTLDNCCYNPQSPFNRHRHGIAFFGTLGTMVLDRGGYEIIPHQANGGCEAKERGSTPMNEPHWENFVHCIRTREEPMSEIAKCHNSTNICQLAAASYFSGGALEWNLADESFSGKDKTVVKAANKFINREYENGWSLKAPYNKNWG